MEYQDRDGNPVSLHRLVRWEPEWAASRIEWLNALVEEMKEDVAELRRLEANGVDNWEGYQDD